jgi:Copper binding proteins, plastocyanin/azurin family
VSRALAAIVVLALVATLSLVPEGTIVGNSQAAAANCAWQRHSKRIVKHVRRQGRVRRVARVKHWWTCNPLAAAPTIEIPPAPLPAPGSQPGPEPEPPPRRVSVKAEDAQVEDFSFSLSRPFVVSGEVTVELNNQGQDPHNLNLRREGSEDSPLEVGEAGPGESRVARLTLPPGTYRLWCSLPQHEEWGMNVDLEVRDG